VAWSVRSTTTAGTKSYRDTLQLRRPRIIGVGAFTIPALPVAVIYEPPAVGGGSSSQTYTVESSVGNSVRLEFAQGQSTTTPGAPSKFATIGALSSAAESLAAAVSSSDNDVLKGIGAGLGAVVK